MQQTFFFYDLETSGLDPRRDRIMQFAGIRTDSSLEQIDEPVNLLIKLSDDVLPSPQAILVTGITPQATQADGITEAEFCRYFLDEVMQEGTILLGYNNIAFDDEFVRYTLWRSFRDAYDWAYTKRCSRWDLLNVVRMVRALRPKGINWPDKQVTDSDGNTVTRPTVNLVDMARSNGFTNEHAHDALSDVQATINLAKLIKSMQPKLWEYLLNHRNKMAVSNIVKPLLPFVITSSRIGQDYLNTSVVDALGSAGTPGSYVCWDLRHGPASFVKYNDDDIIASLTERDEVLSKRGLERLPLLRVKLNACPIVAPLGTLDPASETRIGLDKSTVLKHHEAILKNRQLVERILRIYPQTRVFTPSNDVDGALYDGFLADMDKSRCRVVASSRPKDLVGLKLKFKDARLPALLLRYKARNYPQILDEDERDTWDKYRAARLQRDLPEYLKQLNDLYQKGADDFILQELQLWAESIFPSE